jgi:hypothetical protein
MTDENVNVRITGESASATAAMRSAAAAVKDGVVQMKTSLAGISGAFETLKSHIIGITGLLAGGALFRSAIKGTVDWEIGAAKLAKALGITTEAASDWQVALHHIGLESQTVIDASLKMSRQIAMHESAFNRLGIATRQSNGEFRATGDVMKDALERLREIHNPIEQNIAAMALFGRGVGEIREMLKLTNTVFTESAARARELGLEVGVNGAAQARAYQESLRDVSLVGKALEMQLGRQLLPVMTQLGTALGSEGPEMARVFGQMLKWLADIVIDLWFGMKELGTRIGGLFAAAMAALRGDISGARQILHDLSDDIEAMDKKAEAMKAKLEEAPRSSSASRASTHGHGPGVPDLSSGGADVELKAQKVAADNRLRDWTAALEKLKDVAGVFRQADIGADIEYWRAKLALVRTNSERDVALRERIEHEIIALKHKAADDEKKAAEEASTSRRAIALSQIDDKRETLRAQLELGQITEAQELASLRELEAEKFAIEKRALEERLKLVEADKLARQKIMDEIALLARQQASALTKVDNDAAIARKKSMESALAPIASAIQQSVNGMIAGTLTLQRALGNLFKSILAEYVSLAAKKLVSWVAGELAMTHATAAGTAARGALEKTAHHESLLAGLATTIKKILNYAHEVFAGVFAFLAPAMGPFAAIPAFAAAAIVSASAGLVSAAGGFDISASTYPLAQLHPREMVLPAHLADVIRGLASQSSGSSEPAGGATHHHSHLDVKISAIDARDVKRFFDRHGGAMADALYRLHFSVPPKR